LRPAHSKVWRRAGRAPSGGLAAAACGGRHGGSAVATLRLLRMLRMPWPGTDQHEAASRVEPEPQPGPAAHLVLPDAGVLAAELDPPGAVHAGGVSRQL